MKVPRQRRQRRSAAISALATAAALVTLLLLRLPSDGRSAARRRAHYAEECSTAELFRNEVHSLTGEDWWLTSTATTLLEQLRSLPAGQYREPQPSAASGSLERLSRLSFVMPWRDANVSVPPVHLNMTLGEYIERADYSLVLLHALAALVFLVGGWLLACGPHAVVWRRCPRLQPSARPHSELRRSVPKLGLRVLFACSCLLAVVMMWANGALSAVLLELPARYESAMAALHAASGEAEAAALSLRLQVELEIELAAAAAGVAGAGDSGGGDTGRNISAVGRMSGGCCEASIVIASLHCYATQMDAMAAGLNATWPVLQQSDGTAGGGDGNVSLSIATVMAGGGSSSSPAESSSRDEEAAGDEEADSAGDDTGADSADGADGDSDEDSIGGNGQAAIAAGDPAASSSGDGERSFLQSVAMGNSVREQVTTACASLLLLLSWLAVLSSTYERPGLLNLCSLLSAWAAAGFVMSGMAVLLCAILLADLCAVADLPHNATANASTSPSLADYAAGYTASGGVPGSYAAADGGGGGGRGVGREPGRVAYEQQALRLASTHLQTQPICHALIAGPSHVSDAVSDGVVPTFLPAWADAAQCGEWLTGTGGDWRQQHNQPTQADGDDGGGDGDSGIAADSADGGGGGGGVGLVVANMSGQWPSAHHYLSCTSLQHEQQQQRQRPQSASAGADDTDDAGAGAGADIDSGDGNGDGDDEATEQDREQLREQQQQQQDDEDDEAVRLLPAPQQAWLREWLWAADTTTTTTTTGGDDADPTQASPTAEADADAAGSEAASASASGNGDDVGSCEAAGVPYVDALSPLPCREGLPVLITMWLSLIGSSIVLCCTSCWAASSAHSFHADQLWEEAVTAEVERLMQRKEQQQLQQQEQLVADSKKRRGRGRRTRGRREELQPQARQRRRGGGGSGAQAEDSGDSDSYSSDGDGSQPLPPQLLLEPSSSSSSSGGPDWSFYSAPQRFSASAAGLSVRGGAGSSSSSSSNGGSGGGGGSVRRITGGSRSLVDEERSMMMMMPRP
jgi:hypothetical protein